MKHLKSEEETANEICIGHVIGNLWRDKVNKTSSTSKQESGYENLRRREVGEDDKTVIRGINDETVENLKLICVKHKGWFLDSVNGGKLQMIKVSSSQDVTLDGRRLVFELSVTLEPPSITICTHGEPVVFEEFNDAVSMFAIETAIRFLESESICIGNAVPPEESVDSISKAHLKTSMGGSKLSTISTSNSSDEIRLFSTSCLLITFGRSRACKNCMYISRLWKTRARKRRAKGETLHKKCNVRHLARIGLEEKVCSQRKELRNECVKEKRLLENMIEFSESDSLDLKEIVKQVDNDVSPHMTLLWEMQKKQLATKSKLGYRWHPR